MPKKCSRTRILLKELTNDWDELNVAFKSLIIICCILFIVVICMAIFVDVDKGMNGSIEVIFRSTLASVFGFLLSSNIKSNNKNNKETIEKIKSQLKEIEIDLNELNEESDKTKNDCELENSYSYKDINLVQVFIALIICIVSILIINFLLITNNLDNVPAISQIKDLMCSSIGFLIGESGKK